jgi:hypothetical protein
VSQSLRFSASLIGLKSLGFVGALWTRAPACPPFIVALRERGSTIIHDRRPDQDVD